MRLATRARAEELSAFAGEPEPVDAVSAVRQGEWGIWAAWLLGENPRPAVAAESHAVRCAWNEWMTDWERLAHPRPEDRRCALSYWHRCGLDFQWKSGSAVTRKLRRGSALYIVSRGRLRLRIELAEIMTRRHRGRTDGWLRFKRRGTCRCADGICGCPVAFEPLTLDRDAPSPRGMRRRWWPRELEIPCPDWREAALGVPA